MTAVHAASWTPSSSDAASNRACQLASARPAARLRFHMVPLSEMVNVNWCEFAFAARDAAVALIDAPPCQACPAQELIDTEGFLTRHRWHLNLAENTGCDAETSSFSASVSQ